MTLSKLPKAWGFQFDRKLLIAILILLPLHFALAKLSAVFAFSDGTAAIWPSTGVFLTVLLVWGKRFWVAIWICDLIVIQTLWYTNNPLLSFMISWVDLSDPLIVSWLLSKFIPHYPFNRAIDTIKFIALLIPYPILSAVIGVSIQCLVGWSNWKDFNLVWRGWFISVVISILIITPLLLTWFHPSLKLTKKTWFSRSLTKWNLAEFGLAITIVLGIGYFAFWQNISIEYMIILPLLWAAFRFGQRETTLLILLAVIVAILATAKGYGSFAQESIAQSLMLLQSFMSVLAIATLVLAAAVQESRISAAQLQQANDQLEERVNLRTAELTKTVQQLQTTQSQLIQQEKMSSLGQLVAGVAHEINNPINFIHGNLNHIQSYTQDLLDFIQLHHKYYPNPAPEIQTKAEDIDLEFLEDDLEKILNSMRIGTDRIRQIVLSLRNFSRMDEAECKEVNIHEGIDSTLLILQHRLKATSERPEIQVIKNYGSLPLIECYAGQLNQVFMNILVNAIDALEEMQKSQIHPDAPVHQSTITISTQRLDAKSIQIAIADNGTGMSQTTLKRLFNPFFTTKPIGKGTGMGMSISHQIITEKHGGKLECFSTLGKGTEFLIIIPKSLGIAS